MKCDELKDYDIMDIEAMDDERLEKSESGKIQATRVYIKSDVDAAIAELKAENKRLKKCEIWMKQHFYCEEVIACESAKNRKLKRALYKACANWAMAESYSELNDVPTANRWVHTLRKLKAKLEAYK